MLCVHFRFRDWWCGHVCVSDCGGKSVLNLLLFPAALHTSIPLCKSVALLRVQLFHSSIALLVTIATVQHMWLCISSKAYTTHHDILCMILPAFLVSSTCFPTQHKLADEMVHMIYHMSGQQKAQLEGLAELSKFVSREVALFSSHGYKQLTELGHQALARANFAVQWWVVQHSVYYVQGFRVIRVFHVILENIHIHCTCM